MLDIFASLTFQRTTVLVVHCLDRRCDSADQPRSRLDSRAYWLALPQQALQVIALNLCVVSNEQQVAASKLVNQPAAAFLYGSQYAGYLERATHGSQTLPAGYRSCGRLAQGRRES